MILIRFHDICTGHLARFSSKLINIKQLSPLAPSFIGWSLSQLGMNLLAFRNRVDNRIIESNLTQIIGLDERSAKREALRFRKNRSARIVLNELMRRKYYTRYTVEYRYQDNAAYPETGCVFALAHTVEPYILPAAVGGMVADKGEQKLHLLRAPQSQQEADQFNALAKWTGAYDIGNYLDPGSSKGVKSAVRALRSGEKLLSYIDMPAQFGRSPSVEFFGRRAWMALGAIDLAKLAKVPIYVCHFERDDNKPNVLILVMKRIESNQPDTAQLVAHAVENIVRNSPSSWDFLASLRSYYYHPGDIG